MNDFEVNSLIAHGKYDHAIKIIENDPESLMNRIYLSRIYELTGQFEKSEQIARSSLNRSISNNELTTIIEACSALSYALWRLGRFSEALSLINEIIERIKESVSKMTTDRLSAVGTLYNINGLIDWKTNKLNSALEKFETSLSYRLKLNEKSNVSYTLNNIGNTYLLMGNLKKSNEYYQKSRDIRIDLDTKPGIAASYNSFARLYEAEMKMYMALKSHLASLKLWQEIGNQQFIAKSYRFLGTYYIKTTEMSKAKNSLKEAIELFEAIPNKTDANLTKSILSKIN